MIPTIDKSALVRTAQDGFAALQALEISTLADLELVNNTLHWASEQEKILVTELRECTAPLREAEAKARSWFAPALAALSELRTSMKAKLGAYTQRQATENTTRLAAAAEAFKSGETEQGIVHMAEVMPTSTLAGTTVRQVWTFEITHADDVPRNCCKPDEVIIRARVKAGSREISGVRIYQTTSTIVRGRK